MTQIDRRSFLAAGAAFAAPAVSPAFAATPAPAASGSRGKPFQLRYAPHFGLFENHAKDLVDQLQFAADEGFTAWEDNGMAGRDEVAQEKLAAKMQQCGIAMGVFVAHADFGAPTFASGKQEHKDPASSIRARTRATRWPTASTCCAAAATSSSGRRAISSWCSSR
jgi:hypothetical protein